MKEAITKDFMLDTHDHVLKVGNLLATVCNELMKRAVTHDKSKYRECELDGHLAAHKDHVIAGRPKFGSSEREKIREKHKTVFCLHHKNNPHHPEHHKNGINDMNLIDVLEMLCDWCARSKDIDFTFEENSGTYSISPQLLQILKNTVKDLQLNC